MAPPRSSGATRRLDDSCCWSKRMSCPARSAFAERRAHVLARRTRSHTRRDLPAQVVAPSPHNQADRGRCVDWRCRWPRPRVSRRSGAGDDRDIAVQWVLRCDHDDQGRSVPPASTPRLLTETHGAARIAREDRHIERPDVDSEFEGHGCQHANDVPTPEATLDLQASCAGIASSVGDDPARKLGVASLVEEALRLPRDPFDGAAGLRESDGAVARDDRCGEEAGCLLLAIRIRDGAARVVEQRVPDRNESFSLRRSSSRSTSQGWRAIRCSTCSTGFPIVAVEQMKRGSAPYLVAIRRTLRITWPI